MKKSTKFLLAMAALAFGTSSYAQKTCDLKLELIASPTTVNYHDTSHLTIKVTNIGTATMTTTDTMYLGQIGSSTIFPMNFTSNVAAGASQTFTNALYIRHNFDTLTADLTLELCLKIYPQSTITSGGNPVTVTYNDPVGANDSTCVSVTFKKKTTGIFEFSDYGRQLSIYPNPATTDVKFDINLDKAENIKVSVKDIAGREVMNKDFGMVVAGRQVQLSLDVTKLQAGMYFVEVNGTEKIATGKFVIK